MSKKKEKPVTKTVDKSAKTGRFVSKKTVEKDPDTTVTMKVPVTRRKKKTSICSD